MTIQDQTMPVGYKLTEVGAIPTDWGVKEISELAYFMNGKAHENFISDSGKFVVVNSKFISTNGNVRKHSNVCLCPVERDSILMVMSDVPNGKAIAKCFMVDKNNYYTLNQRICSLKPKIDPKFLLYKINRNPHYLSFDDGVKQTNLRREDVLGCKLGIPESRQEQTHIATTLSDMDELITHLDELIQKKKTIKQGAMQLLLTPKKDWEVKKLGEIGTITGAGVDKKIKENEEPVRLLNYMDVYRRDFIYSKELNHWVTAPIGKLTQCSVRKGDVFFTPSSELQNDIAHSAVAMEDMNGVTYSYHVMRLRIEEDRDLKFKAYIFKNRFFYNQAERFAEGSGKRYVISLTRFRELDVAYPKSKEEQARIATILSNMDHEIQELEQKKSKYEQIKQGAMQQLLTGKIRLK